MSKNRFLCIDFGLKCIGIAISDEEGILAFPKENINNDKYTISKIKNLLKENNISEIVIGESLDLTGGENKIMLEIKKFLPKLLELKLPIHFEKEFLTSVHAQIPKSKDIFSARKIKKEEIKKNDASAATLILQRFLDKRNKKF